MEKPVVRKKIANKGNDMALKNGKTHSKLELQLQHKRNRNGIQTARPRYCRIGFLGCMTWILIITGAVTNGQGQIPSKTYSVSMSKTQESEVAKTIQELSNPGTEDKVKFVTLFQLFQHADLSVISGVLEYMDGDKSIMLMWDNELGSLLHAAVTRYYILVSYLVLSQGFEEKLLHEPKFRIGLIEKCLQNIQSIREDEFEERLKIMEYLFSFHPELVESEVTPHERTPLHFAVEENFENGMQLELIQFLIDYDANVNAVDARGYTPLLLEVLSNPSSPDLLSIIHILIENKADPNIVGKCGHSFLYIAAVKVDSSSYFHEIVSYFVKLPNAQLSIIRYEKGGHGSTILHELVFHFDVLDETLQLFYDLNVDFNAVDDRGDSIFHYAVRGGRDESFLKRVIGYGADWKIDNKLEENSLHWAVSYGNLPALKLLISLGVDVNAVNSVGDTAIFYPFALEETPPSNTFELVQELLSHGADIHIKDFCGKSLIHRAQLKFATGELEKSVLDLLKQAKRETNMEL
ncbi:unnamed protein product [Orchesella dallaii]|uniref:Uncharacterized protein n=1 Tax=Orchesella dallaii TaxID=48710 RepID=A0ABP1REZ2_9HEXA